jgi:hypothetical protein
VFWFCSVTQSTFSHICTSRFITAFKKDHNASIPSLGLSVLMPLVNILRTQVFCLRHLISCLTPFCWMHFIMLKPTYSIICYENIIYLFRRFLFTPTLLGKQLRRETRAKVQNANPHIHIKLSCLWICFNVFLLRLSFISILFPSGFKTNILHALLISPLRATYSGPSALIYSR